MNVPRLFATAALGAALLALPLVASADTVAVALVSYTTEAAATHLRTVTVDSQPAVEASGTPNLVRIDYAAALAKAGSGKTLSLAKVGVRRTDLGGPLEMNLSLGGASAAASAKLRVEGTRTATFAPQFAGSTSFSVVVAKAGRTLQSVRNATSPVTIPDFDARRVLQVDTTHFTFALGLERRGAWSVRIEQDDFVVTATAETPHAASPTSLHVGASQNLVTLVGQRFETVDATTLAGR